jgi:uncharacterized protein
MCDNSRRVNQQNRFFEIRDSGIHGKGGFALLPIPGGTRIVEYVGERISKKEAAKRCEAQNPFIFYIDEEWDIDGNVESNPARFFNHCCEPNCEAECVDGRIWLVALRNIEKGEELTFNYGYDLENYEDHPCSCSSPNCRGFIIGDEYELPKSLADH